MYALRALIEGIETVFLLDVGSHCVGRSVSNQIVLSTPGISRKHAVIEVSEEGVVVEDLDSLNGILVEDEKIVRAHLQPGTSFYLATVPVTLEKVAPKDARLAIRLKVPHSVVRRFSTDSGRLDLEQSTLMIALGQEPVPLDRGLVFPANYCRGQAAALQRTYRQMRFGLGSERPVLVVGETGVGKEMIVEALHRSSRRREGPLVSINCAAIPSSMLEAELFGVGKGVATGVDSTPGRFRDAQGGMLFLDEIGELSPAMQAKLLRVLQSDEIQPVGSAPRKVDVWVVAATNVDIQEKMLDGSFRPDLYYRLAANVVEVPSLRQRQQDIPKLVEFFLGRAAKERGVAVRGMTTRALELLVDYPWPGNIRELEHEIHRLVFGAAHGAVIESGMLPGRIRSTRGLASRGAENRTEELTLEPKILEVEANLIQEALRRAGGIKSRAAELLGISRNGLTKKMKRLGIEVPTSGARARHQARAHRH